MVINGINIHGIKLGFVFGYGSIPIDTFLVG